MLYCVRRWRLSDLNFLPSSRQIMKSGVIDFLTAMAGFTGSPVVSLCPLETRSNAVCTWLISEEISPAATALLLTYADTMPAVSSMKLSDTLSFIAVAPPPARLDAQAGRAPHQREADR